MRYATIRQRRGFYSLRLGAIMDISIDTPLLCGGIVYFFYHSSAEIVKNLNAFIPRFISGAGLVHSMDGLLTH